jgi:hypothetical protein
MRKRKPTKNPPTPEVARPPPTWTWFPPSPPSVAALGNLDIAERQYRRDQYSLDQRAWEREQEQARQAQAREDELRRALAEMRAEALAARRVARRALARDRALTQTNAKTLAALKAAQRDLAAKGGPKATAKRGPKGYPPAIKEKILAEAGRMRDADIRVTASALLNRRAVKKLGNNCLPSTRTISQWLSRNSLANYCRFACPA